MPSYLKIFGGVVIASALLLAITSVWNDSIIVDEVPHIGAGYTYLARQDMRLNPEHPPLVKDLAALPLVIFKDLKQSVFWTPFWNEYLNGQWDVGRYLIFQSDNDANWITHAVKLPVLIFFVLASGLVFYWSWRRYGPVAGALALLLFAFSPTVMAHARFVTTDVAALWGILFATYFFIQFLQAPTRKSLIIAAVVFGLALLTKFSTFLLIPYLGLVAVIWGWIHGQNIRERLRLSLHWLDQTILMFIIGFVVIVWPVYMFHTWNYPPERQRADTEELMGGFQVKSLANVIVWMSDKPVLRAAGQYGLGFLMVAQRSEGGNTIFFLGGVANEGGPLYFPLAYLIKEPIAWLILIMIALMSAIIIRAKSETRPTGASSGRKDKVKSYHDWLRKNFVEVVMLLWLAIYWFISVRSSLNIGLRHMLPVYPFTIILVSGQITKLLTWLKHQDKKYFRDAVILVGILMGWYVFENVRIWPYYLTYFNQFIGGPSQGYKYVVDSNLDWGQDLKRLSQWVEKQDVQKIDLDYFGWADPVYYLGKRFNGINSHTYKNASDFSKKNITDGWIAVSATFLQNSIGPSDKPELVNYTWLKAYEPVTVIGNSIFVWHIK